MSMNYFYVLMRKFGTKTQIEGHLNEIKTAEAILNIKYTDYNSIVEKREKELYNQLKADLKQLRFDEQRAKDVLNNEEIKAQPELRRITEVERTIRMFQRQIENQPDYNSKVYKIGWSIQRRREFEAACYSNMRATSRADTKGKLYWICDYTPLNPKKPIPVAGEEVVSKHTPLGEKLSRYQFNHTNDELISFASYGSYTVGIMDLTIEISGDKHVYKYRRLADLIGQVEEAKRNMKDYLRLLDKVKAEVASRIKGYENAKSMLAGIRKKIAETENQLLHSNQITEKAKAEVEAKRLKEEQERLAQKLEEEKRSLEEKKKEEERDKLAAEKYQRALEDAQNALNHQRAFTRTENSLRQQHRLDNAQLDAKIVHMYDGIPVVIEGGPGTGKTTTIVQRIKFLIAPEAVNSYKNPLTKEQKEYLLDPDKIDDNWIFISPSRPLLMFLRNNMISEGLVAKEQNTITINRMRNEMFSAYKLRNPRLKGPFSMVELDDEDEENVVLILNPQLAIKGFNDYVLFQIKENLRKIAEYKSNAPEWSMTTTVIKSDVSKAKDMNNLQSIINLFSGLKDFAGKQIEEVNNKINLKLNAIASKIASEVEKDDIVKIQVSDILDKRRSNNTEYESNGGFNERSELEIMAMQNNNDFTNRLVLPLKDILKYLSQINNNEVALTSQQQEIWNIIKKHVETVLADEQKDWETFCKGYCFIKRIGYLCMGVEYNLLDIIPKAFKAYRESLNYSHSKIYNQDKLKTIIDNGNQELYPEEISLLIGYINHLLVELKIAGMPLYKKCRHKYVDALTKRFKPVIGIDEATDYSLLDYYFMCSFKYPEFSSITLCGDIMQGLKPNGIENWNDLEFYIGQKSEVQKLSISYRQTPTLVEMSRKMYKDERGEDAPFNSKNEKSDDEGKPIMLISDDDDVTTKWIAQRINEIYTIYNQEMPSVAIFVGEDVSVKRFIKKLKKHTEYMNAIHVEDCTDNRQAESSNIVRVFNLKEVKGMEFEVAIFYKIDEALEDHNNKLLRRYLYVGISRATTHLAATFTQKKGNEDIISYFDNSKDSWL